MSMVKMPMETKMSEVNLSVEQMSNSKNVCGEKGVWKIFPTVKVSGKISPTVKMSVGKCQVKMSMKKK